MQLCEVCGKECISKVNLKKIFKTTKTLPPIRFSRSHFWQNHRPIWALPMFRCEGSCHLRSIQTWRAVSTAASVWRSSRIPRISQDTYWQIVANTACLYLLDLLMLVCLQSLGAISSVRFVWVFISLHWYQQNSKIPQNNMRTPAKQQQSGV